MKRDFDMLTGLSSEDLSTDQTPTEEELRQQEEYAKWLEEGIKSQKGYASMASLEGTAEETKEGEDSYAGSTWESYAKQQAEVQEQIRKLKAIDMKNYARDNAIIHFLSAISILRSSTYLADGDFFMNWFRAILWYLFSSLAMVGLFFLFGVRGFDLIIAAGIGGVVGALVRYNGREGYTFSEALERGMLEVSLLGAAVVSWVINLFTEAGFLLVIFIAAVFGCVGINVRERAFFARGKKETFYKCGFFLANMVLVVVFYLIGVVIGLMLSEAGK